MRRTLTLCLLAIAGAGLTGCAKHASPMLTPSTTHTVAPSPTATKPAVPMESAPTSAAGPFTGDASPDAETAPLPPPTSADATAARDLADSFMRAFIRKDLDKQAWFAGIQNMLTDQARTGYSFTDPATISATTAGVASSTVISDDGTITVTVPTDAGDYHVLVVDGAGTWQIARAIPPVGAR